LEWRPLLLYVAAVPLVGLSFFALVLHQAGLPVSRLFDPAAVLLVIGPLVGLSVMACPGWVLRTVAGILRRDSSLSKADCLHVERLCGQLGQMAVLSAFIAMLLFLVSTNVSGTTSLNAYEGLGDGIAVAAICMAWGLGCKVLVLTPLANASARISGRRCEQNPKSSPETAGVRPSRSVFLAGLLIMLASWGGGLASISPHDWRVFQSSTVLILLPLALAWLAWRAGAAQPHAWVDALADQADATLIAYVISSLLGVSSAVESISRGNLTPAMSTVADLVVGLTLYFVLRALGLWRHGGDQRDGPIRASSHALWASGLIGTLYLGGMFAYWIAVGPAR
jgi:hypothetical protein